MLSPDRAEQFHAVYKGVVAPALFAAMVQELASGEACEALWCFSSHTNALGCAGAGDYGYSVAFQMLLSIRCSKAHQSVADACRHSGNPVFVCCKEHVPWASLNTQLRKLLNLPAGTALVLALTWRRDSDPHGSSASLVDAVR